MMSDSDDTDVLLLIPPDLFLVPSSSESDVSSNRGEVNYSNRRTGVIGEIVEHMQSLESRINAIESKDTSLDATLLNNSLDSQLHNNTAVKLRQTLPKTKFHLNQSSSLQNTPIKPRRSLSVPSTPNSYSLSSHNNLHQDDMKSGNCFPMANGTNATNTTNHDKNKHDYLISQSDSSVVVPSASRSVGFLHATSTSSKGEPCSYPFDYYQNTSNMHNKPSCNQLSSLPSTSTLISTTGQPNPCSKTNVHEMELFEVDELLQEMEATELELSKRINRVSMQQSSTDDNDILLPNQSSDTLRSKVQSDVCKQSINRKLDFDLEDLNQYHDAQLGVTKKKYSDLFPDISLPYDDSLRFDRTDKMISEFKTWEQNIKKPSLKTEQVEGTSTLKDTNNIDKSVSKPSDAKRMESTSEQATLNVGDTNSVAAINAHAVQTQSMHKNSNSSLLNELTQYNTATSTRSTELYASCVSETYKSSQQNGNVQHMKEVHEAPFTKSTVHASTNTDFFPRKSQRLLSLSDFWDNTCIRSQEEMRKIKLEEEKFRREHCEHLIQELQKRLLEQQEKVAVALRVDNEKNELIAQFHNAWSKLKQRLHVLENEYNTLQTNLKNVTEKHQLEILEFQSQIKRYEGELSKALDLAAGYKEKSDTVMKEKLELLESHANELENYKSLVQAADSRYEQLKIDYDKVLEKNKQNEETMKNIQQELTKERLKGVEVRNEMNVIHKALDTCEAELTVLRQEKENLQLKLKEETNRNAILQQKNNALVLSVDDAKKAEKVAKDETKSLAEQKEQIRLELQEVYQKQVDEVVKVKLQEFQTQLDAAESEFLEELKTRQQVIAECAARKIKDIIDKHRLEINLLEEKHKEEKRLCELQLAQVLQKSAILETQLNSQRATKSQLAEQLHSVMQKQWQQALHIISGGNMEDLTPIQKIHAEKLFRGPKKSESMPNCYARVSQEPIRLSLQPTDIKNFHDQNESLNTMTPIEDTPLSSKESKDDLRKYVKMIVDIQKSREEFLRVRENIPSPPLACREVPRKHYMKKELIIKDEDNVTWQPASETTQDTTEFIPISQKACTKGDQHRTKPPWK
ncbi:PREDICTED: restin homolog [Dufourea novaeangliae]|uniref:Centrobin n=1 Tax=Dufourea novaeangliae TaxID=178035 RepID=A0A154PC93_DUFNO|nr:PREDICTED: restin homolog [Dufourea novaeangliae]KZC09451.1 Centrobin [Dufourea novaeangliae]